MRPRGHPTFTESLLRVLGHTSREKHGSRPQQLLQTTSACPPGGGCGVA